MKKIKILNKIQCVILFFSCVTFSCLANYNLKLAGLEVPSDSASLYIRAATGVSCDFGEDEMSWNTVNTYPLTVFTIPYIPIRRECWITNPPEGLLPQKSLFHITWPGAMQLNVTIEERSLDSPCPEVTGIGVYANNYGYGHFILKKDKNSNLYVCIVPGECKKNICLDADEANKKLIPHTATQNF